MKKNKIKNKWIYSGLSWLSLWLSFGCLMMALFMYIDPSSLKVHILQMEGAEEADFLQDKVVIRTSIIKDNPGFYSAGSEGVILGSLNFYALDEELTVKKLESCVDVLAGNVRIDALEIFQGDEKIEGEYELKVPSHDKANVTFKGNISQDAKTGSRFRVGLCGEIEVMAGEEKVDSRNALPRYGQPFSVVGINGKYFKVETPKEEKS